jgi:hypothetical protein
MRSDVAGWMPSSKMGVRQRWDGEQVEWHLHWQLLSREWDLEKKKLRIWGWQQREGEQVG